MILDETLDTVHMAAAQLMHCEHCYHHRFTTIVVCVVLEPAIPSCWTSSAIISLSRN
jgi:hypothetical protein